MCVSSPFWYVPRHILFRTNLKNKAGFGIGKDHLNMAADVLGWFPFITCILSVSNQSCSGNVRPTLKVSFRTFLLNYVKKKLMATTKIYFSSELCQKKLMATTLTCS